MPEWSDEDGVLCDAPGGPDGHHCSGRVGHGGLHGFQDARWSDDRARLAVTEGEVQEVLAEAASAPLRVFRGVAYTVGRQAFRGVVTLLDGWVHVELVGHQSGMSHGHQDGVSAVLLPVHEVAAIDVATEQADRA